MSSSPPIPGPAQEPYSSQPVTIFLTVILLAFFFLGFCSVYFCRCFSQSMMATWNNRLNPSGTNGTQNAASPGLDLQIIQTFPKFKYSAVKDLRKGKIGFECAICLSEFADEDFLRLLTICCHVFHQDCVDLWLQSHTTCPVCRAALDSPPDEKSMAKVSHIDDNNNSPEVHLHGNGSDGSVRISIKEDEDENEIRNVHDETGIQSAHCNLVAANKRRAIAEKFSKCRSTGHSIFRNKVEDMDKYTLRLPDHVREEITRGHQWAKSCTLFGECSAKQGNGFGEMSGFSG